MSLSKEGEKFILDLNAYLVASGKNEEEIKEFIEQAEDHLKLGEKEGKTVEDIFGCSPMEYAKSIEKELSFDKKGVLSIGLLVLFFIFTWTFLNNLSKTVPSYSLLEAIGIPLIFLLSISLVIYSFRKFAFDDQKLKVISVSVFVFQVLAFIVIGLISKDMPKVIILTDSLIKILVLLLLFISILVGIKSKSLIYTLLPFIMNLTGILNHTTRLHLSDESSLAFTILGILIFIVDTKFRTKEINK